MKYDFIADYKDNDMLRNGFNKLAEKTFAFNLEDWYRNGFWGDNYIPYSIMDGNKIVANISVNIMDFMFDGKSKHYIQLGTVMTDKDYRGQGLSRFLMEKIISEYRDKVDGIYLFANDSVLDFYPKFGFKSSKEYQCRKTIHTEEKSRRLKQIDLTDQESREKFFQTVKDNICNYRLVMDNFGITAFWTTGLMSSFIYYEEEEDAYLVCEIKDDILWLYDIFSINKVNPEQIIKAFGNSVRQVNFGFSPFDTDGFEITEYRVDDCTLFYMGDDFELFEKHRLMFPMLSHA